MGQPTLPVVDINAKNNPDAVAGWIMRNVPSFVGKVPHQWTEAVITKLQRSYIQDHVIRDAFKRSRAKGMEFEAPAGYPLTVLKEVFPVPVAPKRQPYRSTGVPPPPTLGNVHPSQWNPFWVKENLRRFEAQYIKATINHDPVAVTIMATAFQLFWEFVKAKLGEKKKANEVQWAQEWDRLVNEAFQEARNLESNVRRLTRAQLRQLRQEVDPNFEALFQMPQFGIPGEEGEGEGEAD